MADAAERLRVEIDGQPVAFADQTKSLEGALMMWCGAKLARLLRKPVASR
jgi:hypothetical protein